MSPNSNRMKIEMIGSTEKTFQPCDLFVALSADFLSDPGIPGVRSMGPSVSK